MEDSKDQIGMLFWIVKSIALFSFLFLTLNLSKLHAQPEIVFSEDFELNGISQWTLYSNSTDDWNLTTDDGIDGLSCVRCNPDFFETPFPENDAWIISPEIDASIYESVNFEFYTRMYDEGIGLEIYYSTNYDGSFTTANWNKLDSIYNEDYYIWYLSEYTFETNNEDFYIAFRYQSTTAECNWWYVDEITIQGNLFEIIPVGASEHFEYYCYAEADTNFMTEISEELEMKYQKYCLDWNRPGQPKALDNEFQKIKVYYGDRDDHLFDDIVNAPNWKCSFYDTQNMELFLCPLNTENQTSYYNDLIGLAKHTLGAYAYYKRQERDGYIYYPAYYQEGFGLYESGYRPNRDSIILIRNEYISNISYEDLYDTSMIVSTAKKDLIVSYLEGQILCYLGYRYCFPDYGSYTNIWNRFLSHFYDTTDVVQIKNYYSSDYIDVYCSTRDTMYQEDIAK